MQAQLHAQADGAADAAAGPTAASAAAEPPHLPLDLRSASLMLIALMAGLYMLRWAGAVIIPVLLAVMVSYALSPLLERLQRAGMDEPGADLRRRAGLRLAMGPVVPVARRTAADGSEGGVRSRGEPEAVGKLMSA